MLLCHRSEIIYQVLNKQRLPKQQQHENQLYQLKQLYPGFGDLNQGPISCSQPPQWPFFYIKQGSGPYDFIHCARCMNSQVTGYMNSYFLMYEFISGGAMCKVPSSLWRHLAHQYSLSLLPRPIRVCSAAPTITVCSAAPTSQGAFGCPDQLGCVQLPRSVRVRMVGGVGQKWEQVVGPDTYEFIHRLNLPKYLIYDFRTVKYNIPHNEDDSMVRYFSIQVPKPL